VANKEDIRRYQIHLSSSGPGTPKISATVSVLRFLFDVTLVIAPAPFRMQVATIRGWKITSGYLKNVAGSLRALGLIDYLGDA
jgi:hypothetical protein